MLVENDDIVETKWGTIDIEQDMNLTEVEQDIDLMDTVDKANDNFECEHDSDIEFMDDEQLSDE